MAGNKLNDNEDGPEATGLSSNPGKVSAYAAVGAPDRNKRRLIRGAAVAGPVLLTLRSGALAAVSCTPVKSLGVTVNNGEITIPSGFPSYNVADPGPEPDICYILSQSDPDCPIGDGSASKTGNEPQGKVVRLERDVDDGQGGTTTQVYYKCEGSNYSSTPGDGFAILSWSAAQSISA